MDENEELKNVNNELVEKLNFLIKQRKEINYYQNENVISKQKEETKEKETKEEIKEEVKEDVKEDILKNNKKNNINNEINKTK